MPGDFRSLRRPDYFFSGWGFRLLWLTSSFKYQSGNVRALRFRVLASKIQRWLYFTSSASPSFHQASMTAKALLKQ